MAHRTKIVGGGHVPPAAIILGIDTGLKGAWAKVMDGKLVGHGLLPLKRRRVDHAGWLAEAGSVADGVDIAVVEQPLVLSRMSRWSIATVWSNYQNIVDGLLGVAGLRVVVIRPRTWQSLAYRGITGKGKARSFNSVKKLLGVKLTHDGVADAALIAYWGYERYVLLSR